MDYLMEEISERIRTLREEFGYSYAKMAEITGVIEKEYVDAEKGISDFSFTFLYKCAHAFHVDIVELLTGEKPRLNFYTVTRKGSGLPIKRRKGFTYLHLASHFTGKLAEVFLVTAPFDPAEQEQPIHLSEHKGQEFDFVLSGSLKVAMEDHITVLHEGDSIYYDSGHGHGMSAIDGNACTFIAVVIGPENDSKDVQ